MIWLGIFLMLLLAICVYLIVAPFYIEIDSTCNLYRIRFHRVAYAGLAVYSDVPVLYFRILWWQRQMNITDMPVPKKATEPLKKKQGRVARPASFHKIWAVIKSFRVIVCDVNIDFGSVMTDAWMFAFINTQPAIARYVRVNFLHESSVRLKVKNNFANMAWSYIHS